MKIKIEKPAQAKLDEFQVENWPIWHYDQQETCYILTGEITVRTADEEVSFGPGDFVTFPKGLDCTWTVSKPVRKHYSFS